MIYLRNFSSVSDANAQGAAGLESPHVDIIDGLDVVNFAKVNDSKFTCSFGSDGKMTGIKWGHQVGDICYWDGSKLAYVPYTGWSNSLGTALAVCVIPSTHASAWGDGKARFISVKGVTSAGTETSLQDDTEMEWGISGDTTLTNYTVVPTWDNTIGGSVGSNSYGCISSDKLIGVTNVIDTNSSYSASTTYMIPSPYATDGSFYSDYIRTIEGNNALSDFNGATNTSTLAGLSSSYIAATACYLYSTNGIASGQWYLPAVGELGYIIPRFNVINSAITACGGLVLSDNYFYFSSSSNSSSLIYSVSTHRGSVSQWSKIVLNQSMRPFCKLA